MNSKDIPLILIYSRLVIAIVILFVSLYDSLRYDGLISLLIITGFLTDVFDGIIARKLKVSTTRLRELDSNIDLVFWLTVLFCALLFHFNFFMSQWLFISAILFLEAVAYIICYIRFHRPVATHSLLAKLWVILLLLFFAGLFYSQEIDLLFYACLAVGFISRIETLLIIILIKQWHADVPSVFSVKALNEGKQIKRHPLFNG